ncbi:retinol dehydrogenase 7 [Parasteatoda tepidariorum]|uniref:retinol dehydrogenase 7 n=1 Tax=Parasteatoda tepidariorum TaxID=114398 RepID=UPI001C72727D|nr:retinol dehydrogenase 7 [Parasteatoda tepidariorum]
MFNTTITHIVCLVFLAFIVIIGGECFRELYFKFSGLACFLCISYLLASFIDNALPRFRATSAKKAVFITGCDRGFGLLLARRLDSLGFKVFAGCLDPLGADVQKLKNTASSRLSLVKIDVTRDESVSCAQEEVKNNLGDCELWALVNNAGVIERGELEWTPMEIYQKQFEVNTFGVVRVTQAFLPLLRRYKGRIVTVTSVGGRFTFSGFVPYCMSKHATSSFCEGLRMEMAKFGVKVITIEPFSYQTGMTDASNVSRSIKQTWSMSSSKYAGDVYDDDYIDEFSDSVRKFNEATVLPDPGKVVDQMVEGVCAISPHYSYVVGCWEFLFNLWMSRRLPKTFVDFFTRKRVTFDCDLEQYLISSLKDKKNS